jgi:hypothetical protein
MAPAARAMDDALVDHTPNCSSNDRNAARINGAADLCALCASQ